MIKFILSFIYIYSAFSSSSPCSLPKSQQTSLITGIIPTYAQMSYPLALPKTHKIVANPHFPILLRRSKAKHPPLILVLHTVTKG